ncbi:MAG: radical SAM family heme chaperone HemW [Lachnospiraceae bacterium]|nr:radical SAM family heme chaperone HemW [Lachnospiraceae bacterium]
MQTRSELEIYVHIPFCVRKCNYCDFLSFPSDENARNEYISALYNEIGLSGKRYEKFNVAHRSGEGLCVTSFFAGGGTPTVIGGKGLAELLRRVKEAFVFSKDAEITAECNPGTVTEKDLILLRNAGFNRLSIGLQSAVEGELKSLGRIHDFGRFKETYDAAVSAGFDNINVDIMTAIPGQSTVSLAETIEKILHLDPRPEHISAYSLIIEPGTMFYDMNERGELKLPSEDTERLMHWQVIDTLEKNGYRLYELSNLALPGYECRHNTGYWTGKQYLGFGLGAASYFGDERFTNTRNMAEYLGFWGQPGIYQERPLEEKEVLSLEDKMSEFMFLGLRMTDGIDCDEFRIRFGLDIKDVYGAEIDKHTKEGLLLKEGKRLRLSRRGQDVANYVFADFV